MTSDPLADRGLEVKDPVVSRPRPEARRAWSCHRPSLASVFTIMSLSRWLSFLGCDWKPSLICKASVALGTAPG